jgi:L-histidine N-alpha-methyltransferase
LRERAEKQIAEDVRRGLSARRKTLPSKYFYDARGSRLFEQISGLPEYYQTRIEMSILRDNATILTENFHNGDLVELGSGANWKIRRLLESMGRSRLSQTRYVPVDVSQTALVAASKGLLKLYPELTVMGIVGDFTKHLPQLPCGRMKLILFFGSTIGNLSITESRSFLAEVASTLCPGDRFLLGLDMIKPMEVLNAAYNDSQGVTEQFNKNVLYVINRELGADFNTDDFEHLAFYNPQLERVEMHLRAIRPLLVEIADLELSVSFEAGETVLTEISRKFSRNSAARMVQEAGLSIARWHSDPNEWFSIAEIVSPGGTRIT